MPVLDDLAAAIAPMFRGAMTLAELEDLVDSIEFEYANLPDGQLGMGIVLPDSNQYRFRISIDTDADGRGWFVDPTPVDNEEFENWSPDQ